MNVLYVLGSVPNYKHTFIKREIIELQNLGFNIYLLVINPFYNKSQLTIFRRIFKPGYNPLSILLNPFLNLFNFKKSVLFSNKKLLISRNFDKSKIHPAKVFFACLFIESSLRKLLKSKIEINHIHTHHLFSGGIFAPCIAELIGSKYSITLHTLSHYLNNSYLKSTLQNASFLRAVTRETEDYFKVQYSLNNIHFIPNGIDFNTLPQRKKGIEQASKLNILAIGYFLDKKGFDILIKSCKIIDEKKIDFHCTIIGEGPDKELFENLISVFNLRNNISLIPFLDFSELVPYFQSSSVLAVPSRDPKRSTRDGLPTVILEAMAMGLPVVASDFAGISDAIIHEKTGLLVEPENEKDLADCILKIHNNKILASTLVENSGSWVQESFSLNKNITRLAELFQS